MDGQWISLAHSQAAQKAMIKQFAQSQVDEESDGLPGQKVGLTLWYYLRRLFSKSSFLPGAPELRYGQPSEANHLTPLRSSRPRHR